MNSDQLNYHLQKIGFRVAGKSVVSKDFIDIEQTLHEASKQVTEDGRLFSLLCSWVLVHGDKVIIEKLMKKQKSDFSPWLVAIAVFAVSEGFHPFKRLIQNLKKPLHFASIEGAKYKIEKHGSFEGMEDRNIFIAKNEVRIREGDVLSQEELIKENRQYRNRYIYGACVRADVISQIEDGTPTAYQIAKKLGCSQGPAYRIMKEYLMVKEFVVV